MCANECQDWCLVMPQQCLYAMMTDDKRWLTIADTFGKHILSTNPVNDATLPAPVFNSSCRYFGGGKTPVFLHFQDAKLTEYHKISWLSQELHDCKRPQKSTEFEFCNNAPKSKIIVRRVTSGWLSRVGCRSPCSRRFDLYFKLALQYWPVNSQHSLVYIHRETEVLKSQVWSWTCLISLMFRLFYHRLIALD